VITRFRSYFKNWLYFLILHERKTDSRNIGVKVKYHTIMNDFFELRIRLDAQLVHNISDVIGQQWGALRDFPSGRIPAGTLDKYRLPIWGH
jgi:hypothetical protein